MHLLCYDFGVFFFMFVFIFQIFWAYQGFNWVGTERGACRDLKAFKFTWYLVVLFWIFVLIGFIIGVFTLMFQAIDEGSCSCLNICYGCVFCCTCGMCNPKISKKEQNRRVERRNNSGNKGSSALQYFGFGCGGKKKRGKKYNQNNEMTM